MKLTSWPSQRSHECPRGDISRYSYGIFRSVSRSTKRRLSTTKISWLPLARYNSGTDSSGMAASTATGSRARRSGDPGAPNVCCSRRRN
jgi:hypothetical protein